MGHAELKQHDEADDDRIETQRFFLRRLQPNDASERYASWFRDPEVKRYIVYSKNTPTVDELRRYIEERAVRPDVLFLGVFERSSGTHIGNVKFEPIDVAASRAVLGILIGDASWRGRGAAIEIIQCATAWLSRKFGISEVTLGVERNHRAAIRAYEKAGFRVAESDEADSAAVRMVWRLSDAPRLS